MILRHLRQYLACRKLNKLIAKQRSTYECEQFRRRRESAKLGWKRRKAAA